MPWIVRRIERPKVWREAALDEKSIREAFGDGNDRISVFKVETDIKEAEVAAALWFSKGAGGDPIHLLRISMEDIESVTVGLAETDGITGVELVDRMHRDLIGSASNFSSLAKLIVSRSHAGEDVVRTVAGRGLSQRIDDFLGLRAIKHTKENKAREALRNADQRWPRG